MNIPPPSDPRWSKIFQTEKRPTFEFLATNMLFTRLVINAKQDASQENLNRLVRELWEVFAKNGHNPKVQADLKRLFGMSVK